MAIINLLIDTGETDWDEFMQYDIIIDTDLDCVKLTVSDIIDRTAVTRLIPVSKLKSAAFNLLQTEFNLMVCELQEAK